MITGAAIAIVCVVLGWLARGFNDWRLAPVTLDPFDRLEASSWLVHRVLVEVDMIRCFLGDLHRALPQSSSVEKARHALAVSQYQTAARLLIIFRAAKNGRLYRDPRKADDDPERYQVLP